VLLGFDLRANRLPGEHEFKDFILLHHVMDLRVTVVGVGDVFAEADLLPVDPTVRSVLLADASGDRLLEYGSRIVGLWFHRLLGWVFIVFLERKLLDHFDVFDVQRVRLLLDLGGLFLHPVPLQVTPLELDLQLLIFKSLA